MDLDSIQMTFKVSSYSTVLYIIQAEVRATFSCISDSSCVDLQLFFTTLSSSLFCLQTVRPMHLCPQQLFIESSISRLVLICCGGCLMAASRKANDSVISPLLSLPGQTPLTHLSGCVTVCQPTRRCCSAWRCSMRRCRAGTATPRPPGASRSCRRTLRNMFALSRSTWECLVRHTHTHTVNISLQSCLF